MVILDIEKPHHSSLGLKLLFAAKSKGMRPLHRIPLTAVFTKGYCCGTAKVTGNKPASSSSARYSVLRENHHQDRHHQQLPSEQDFPLGLNSVYGMGIGLSMGNSLHLEVEYQFSVVP
jgi:hypothetical protein